MKKGFLLSILLSVAALMPGRAALAWEIESFEAGLAVQPDGSVEVTEKIIADFQGEERHGIYRDIPTVSQDRLGIKRSFRLEYRGSVDEEGRPWKAKLTRRGAYLRIRLGSEEATYRGAKAFHIHYRLRGILQAFPEHDELYWNATGNEWGVSIRQASAQVTLPKPVPQGRLLAAGFTGRHGSTASDVRWELEEGRGVRFTATRPFAPMEGLTVVVGWPSGLVRMPSALERLGWRMLDNGHLFLPLLVLAAMALDWWKTGKDSAHGPVAVQYEPPADVAPAEAGTLLDDRVDLKDVTATLVDLARRGYLHIEEMKGKEYLLTRRPGGKKETGPLRTYEQALMTALFFEQDSVLLSSLENKFYQHLPGIRTSIYEDLTRRGYWARRPDLTRQGWWWLAGALAVGAWFVFFSAEILFVLLGSAAVIAAFAPFMPRRSWLGRQARERLLGLEEFLRRTDEDRLQRESDPAGLFERMLPYAMAFGVANQWARAFDGIYQVQPSWYSSDGTGSFTPSDFTRRINAASTQIGSTLSSTPRSSGGSGFSGGSSGGGGGGGGGGAW